MKINELISQFSIALSNEENSVLESMEGIKPLDMYNEREQVVIGNLIRKSLVSKVHKDGVTLVARNERFK
jgi:hypothetical protein